MGEYTVRCAQLTELDDLVHMAMALQRHHELVDEHLWRYAHSAPKVIADDLKRLLSDVDTCVLVGLSQPSQQTVAMATAAIRRNPHRVPAISGSIDRVYVEESHRRHGLGQQLVRHLCEFFSENGVEHMTVRYVVRNVAAERFWQALGFETRIVTAGTLIHSIWEKLDSLRG